MHSKNYTAALTDVLLFYYHYSTAWRLITVFSMQYAGPLFKTGVFKGYLSAGTARAGCQPCDKFLVLKFLVIWPVLTLSCWSWSVVWLWAALIIFIRDLIDGSDPSLGKEVRRTVNPSKHLSSNIS